MLIFDENFTQTLERRYAPRPVWHRPDLYFVACSPERAQVRSWMDEEISHLAQPGQNKLIARLRSDEHFITAYHELATAAALRCPGYRITYEPEINGLTPDLLLEGPTTIIVDVWTRQLPQSQTGERRLWRELCSRIAGIRCPVGLLLLTGSDIPPSSGQAKKIVLALEKWLVHGLPRVGEELEVEGYRFGVHVVLPGDFAMLAEPTPGGWIDSDVLIEAVSNKVSRYRVAAGELGAGLMVVLAADLQALMGPDNLVAALRGRQTVTMTLPVGRSGNVGHWSGRLRESVTPEHFSPDLSAIGWLEPGHGDPHIIAFDLPTAVRPLPPLRTNRVCAVPPSEYLQDDFTLHSAKARR